MYMIGYKNKRTNEWQSGVIYEDGELDNARKRRDELRALYSDNGFEIFECNIIQFLDPEVFKEE